MAKMEAEFVQERAQQLAIVYLTRRETVRVIQNPDSSGPALLASVSHAGRDHGLCLGVEARGTISEHGLRQVGQAFEVKKDIGSVPVFQSASYPVCLFYFTMHNDAGYWKWLRQPVADSPQLFIDQGRFLERLTNQALDEIWTTVEQWHQTQQQLVAA